MTPSRRDLLQLFGALGLGSTTLTQGCTDDPPATPTDAASDLGVDASMMDDVPMVDVPDVPDVRQERDVYEGPPSVFRHGVASGDPMPTAVILWSRVTPLTGMPFGMSVDVVWEVSTTLDFAALVTMGTFTTNADRDWTVKVDATGLTAGTTYYYRFRAMGFTSIIGRTRTAPTGAAARARFGLVSCSALSWGYFHVYKALAERLDLDAIIHLGDYIYEYSNTGYGRVRQYDPPTECVTLSDYRRRYAFYRREPELRDLHQQTPFIVIWDDHESANDSYMTGAQNHNPATDGDWAARRTAAMRAHREWMPIRDSEVEGKIWRKLSYGDLADLVMLDTRLWARPLQVTNPDAGLNDPSRTLLGADQEQWFFQQMSTSRARWKIVVQQVMMGQLLQLLNGDQWDGYPAARDRFFMLLRNMMIQDVVVLTGDIHTSWAMELTENPRDTAAYDPATGRGSLGVEFVIPGVTSPGFLAALAANIEAQVRTQSRHVKYLDLVKRGYGILDVTPERVQCAHYLHTDGETVQVNYVPAAFAAAHSVARGTAHLVRDMAAAPAPANPPAGAPPLAPTP